MTPRRGFSLPELLVALAIAAIVACCAVSSLRQAVRQTRRAAAAATLLELATRQEAHRARHGRYAVDPAALGWRGEADGSVPWPDAARSWYLLRLRATPGPFPGTNGYQALACPLGAQADDPCGCLGIDSSGRREPARPGCW